MQQQLRSPASLTMLLAASLSSTVNMYSFSHPFAPSSSPPDTTREPVDGAEGYFYVSEDIMKADIQAHKFIEYGRHQQQLYGIKADTVEEVMETGKMVVLDVYPQVGVL